MISDRHSAGLLVLRQEVRKADDGMQRRAKLVTHAAQELALQLVGTLHRFGAQLQLAGKSFLNRLEFIFGAFAVRYVANDGCYREALGRFNGAEADFNREAEPSLRRPCSARPLPIGLVSG